MQNLSWALNWTTIVKFNHVKLIKSVILTVAIKIILWITRHCLSCRVKLNFIGLTRNKYLYEMANISESCFCFKFAYIHRFVVMISVQGNIFGDSKMLNWQNTSCWLHIFMQQQRQRLNQENQKWFWIKEYKHRVI